MDPVEAVVQNVTSEPPGMPHSRGGRSPHPIFWVIAVCLLVLTVTQVSQLGSRRLLNEALAQPVSSAGARGVFAFSGPLTKSTFGVFVVDVDAMTLWAYEYQPQKGCLRLAAARTWRYDRYLENYNGCDLAPDAVEQLVEEQRQYRLQSTESQLP
jgi:hypothetical protein